MFVTEESPIASCNTVGVEYVFELFNPAGIAGLTGIPSPWGRLGWGLQTVNPYRDFQRISFFSTCSKYTLIHFKKNKLIII